MKKFLTALTIVAICSAIMPAAAADRYDETVTIAAGATSGVTIATLTRPYGTPASTIDSVFATATSGSGTGTVVITQYEAGTDTAVLTLTGARLGNAASDRPFVRLSSLYTYPVVQNVVTGDYSYAIQNLQTNYAVALSPYLVRQVKIRVGQAAVADDTVYKVVFYVKEDPPPQPR